MSPIFKREGKWYFCDETWTKDHGPFESESEALIELDRYCCEELGRQLKEEE